MAQGNIIQGQASGKLGDTVLMVRNGTQVSRVYTTSGARSGESASLASRLQRVRFGSASNQWQLYRYICTRMFRKGRSTNQSDYNYFVKRNIDNLPYFTKLENADGVCCMMPGQFSEGTLGRIELVSTYNAPTEASRAASTLVDTINPSGEIVSWSATMATLKAHLKKVYINARKVTFLLVKTSETNVTEGGEVFVSQFFQHFPVVIDLYAQSAPGEDEMTVKAFFASKVSDTSLKQVFSDQTGNITTLISSFVIDSPSANLDSSVLSLGVLLFASNDLVSDCYTTIIPAASVNIVTGVYSVWGGYRTANALQVACDSYGYQTGVMRDEVASVDNTTEEQIMSYAARLSEFAPAALKAFEDELPSEISTAARIVRKPEEA